MGARTIFSGLAEGLLDLVFAPVCLACGEPVSAALHDRRVCPGCWARVRPIPPPRCPRCSTPLRAIVPGESPGACTLCPELPPSLRSVRAAFVMEGPGRDLVHALKYGGWRTLAEPMGARMAAVPLGQEAEDEVRVVAPVPLSRVRLRQRGYNQAALLASAVAATRGWTCLPDLLTRTRATETQTNLHPSERRANVAGAFRVTNGREAVHLEHVLLVDDVWTTGATALACGEALTATGARAFSVLTFARALPELRVS